MTSSNFMDTAPGHVQETRDPATAIAWIKSLPVNRHTGRALLCEWARRNNVTLTGTHYAQIGDPMTELLNANLHKLPRQ